MNRCTKWQKDKWSSKDETLRGCLPHVIALIRSINYISESGLNQNIHQHFLLHHEPLNTSNYSLPGNLITNYLNFKLIASVHFLSLLDSILPPSVQTSSDLRIKKFRCFCAQHSLNPPKDTIDSKT